MALSPSGLGAVEVCGCCKKERLIVVRRAIVCPTCDVVHLWPKGR